MDVSWAMSGYQTVFTAVLYPLYHSKGILCSLVLRKGVWIAVQLFDRAHYWKEENFSGNKIRLGL